MRIIINNWIIEDRFMFQNYLIKIHLSYSLFKLNWYLIFLFLWHYNLQALCIVFSYKSMNIVSPHWVVSAPAPGGNQNWCTFFNKFIIRILTPLYYIHLGIYNLLFTKRLAKAIAPFPQRVQPAAYLWIW